MNCKHCGALIEPAMTGSPDGNQVWWHRRPDMTPNTAEYWRYCRTTMAAPT